MTEVSPPRHDRAPLTRERIVRAALLLIDERGLDQLTMRRLGADLGVEAMSLYKHVAGKEAILDGVREMLLREFAATLAAGAPTIGWRDHLDRFAHAYRALGLAHPQAFGLLARSAERAYVAGREIAEDGLERLLEAGLDRRTAILAQRTVVRFVLGFSLVDQAGEDAPTPASAEELVVLAAHQPLVGELMRSLDAGSDEALFDFGLETILDGLAQVVARA
jgi:TetR/AcrR family transcriptional regulator, tetracycline repressor protein